MESWPLFKLGVGIFAILLIGVRRCCGQSGSGSGDIAALIAFKASADPGGVLDSKWKESRSENYCRWEGVRECTANGSVMKLVVEDAGLNGTFADKTLSRLRELRVLSLQGNRLTGTIPDLSPLRNLKSLFLDRNRFTGPFPDSIAKLRHLTVVMLSDNRLSGTIPASIAGLPKMYAFCVQNNEIEGSVPALDQVNLTFFNVSNNQLSGPIPVTAVLSSFNASSFMGNPDLCGDPLVQVCSPTLRRSPPAPLAHSSGTSAVIDNSPGGGDSNKLNAGEIAGIVVGSVVGSVALLLLIFFFVLRRNETSEGAADSEAPPDHHHQNADPGIEQKSVVPMPVLMFCEGESPIYTLEDLLRASAEVLGRGTIGTTYKAVMESGMIVTVKRLRNTNLITKEEFEGHMEAIGKLRHPNIVPVRAYFQAKEERLLVYDYQPNGNLSTLIQGNKSLSGKPIHWTSCLKLAEDVANGLAHLHHSSRLIHGNLKPSNVLISRDFEACIADLGLTIFETEQFSSDEGEEDPSLAAYKAPECKSIKKLSHKADVYSFGMLIMELLTGKTPLPSLLNGPTNATDLLEWVHSNMKQEMKIGTAAPAALDGSIPEKREEKLEVLLNIAVACVAANPDERPPMRAVLRMLNDAKDNSLRWSDNVHKISVECSSDGSISGLERD